MKRTIASALLMGSICLSNPAHACPDGQLEFSFSKLKAMKCR